jgi:hypothetical protein
MAVYQIAVTEEAKADLSYYTALSVKSWQRPCEHN